MRLRYLIASLCLLAGCSETAPAPQQNTPPAKQQASVEPAPSENTVSMDMLSASEIDQLIASHSGKIVVVDLWAMW